MPDNSSQIRVALFDVCHTLVGFTSISDFVDHFLLVPGKNPFYRPVTFWYHILYKILRRLKLVSEQKYDAHFLFLFKGFSEQELEPLAVEYAHRLKNSLLAETYQELLKRKEAGYTVVLVSAGYDVYLKHFAALLDVPLVCSVLEVDASGTYTGRFSGVDCRGEGKVSKTREYLKEYDQINWQESFACGDSLSDVPLLSIVGEPLAVNPEARLQSYAQQHDWKMLETRNTFYSKERRKKIVYLITGLNTGGAEIMLERIVTHLDPVRYEPIVVSMRPIGVIGTRIRMAGVPVISLRGAIKYNPLIFIRLYFLLKKEHPILLHTFLSHSNIFGRIIGRCARVPYIVSSIQNEFFGGRIREKLLQWTDPLCDLTTVLSHRIANRMIKVGIVPQEKLVVIYSGFSVDEYPFQDSEIKKRIRQELGITLDTPMLVSVGRLTKQKGYPYLLQAFAVLKEKIPALHLYILGEGELRAELEALSQSMNLIDSVHFLGNSSRVAEYYTAADVFALASVWEGFGNVVLEAMSAGLPVVITDVCGAAEAIENGQTGFVVPAMDPQALAAGINKAFSLTAEQRQKMTRAARQTVAERFSVQRLLEEHEAFYKRAMKQE